MNDTVYTPPPSAEPPLMTAPPASRADGRNWMAIASLVLGIINFCGLLIPCCGQILPIAGLILGVLGLQSNRRTLAIVGIVLAVLTLCASLPASYFGWQYWNTH